MTPLLRILMLGDSIGKTGRLLFARHIDAIKAEYVVDAVIVNGENSADNGTGITPEIADFFLAHGAQVITTGNHIWDQSGIQTYITTQPALLRPANFPESCPGVGVTFFECKGYIVGVMNLMGRVFMSPALDCPFKKAEALLQESTIKTPIMLVDFHAEATSEKLGLGYFLEGKVTAVVGTHTHTQTNDARILPRGTAYMTDLGMSGSLYSVMGFTQEEAIKDVKHRLPVSFRVETKAPYVMTGAIISIDPRSGKALAIEPFSLIDQKSLEGVE